MADDSLISLKRGAVIAERYEVVKCLGAGSMGLVYACKHKELTDHMVAVKVLFPEVANDAVAAARFKNEIFASYNVSHPNVVRAYEYLRDGDIVAYTMEYVEGGDLAHRLERGEPIPAQEAVQILCQMCAGVQAIHDAKIVHRDLKPENILLTNDGVVKIADFGIARTGYGPKLTEHGGVVGTIDYVSPEYMLNSQVDWRSDIYAMGILAYEMLTGESPFRGESVYATMTKRLQSDPQPPSSINPACPVELDGIILKAMARNVEERYQSASDMFADLQPLLTEPAHLPSGAFLQVKRSNSGSYVGPRLQEGLARDPGPRAPSITHQSVASLTPEEPHAEYTSQPTVVLQNPPSGGYGSQAGRSTSSGTSTSGAMGMHTGGASSSGSYTYGEPEVVAISSHYYDAHNVATPEYVGADTVVSYEDFSVRGVPGREEAAPRPAIREENFDSGRTQRLTQLASRVERSVWVEVATLAVAILIGVGLGFFLVRTFFPDLLGLESAWLGTRLQVALLDVRPCLL